MLRTWPRSIQTSTAHLASQYAIPAPIWQIFRSSLTDQLQLHACPVGLYIPPGSKILEYRGHRLHCKADLPEVPASAKTQFIRTSNPEATHTRLRRESVESLHWLAQTLAQSPERPMCMPTLLQCLAAADACAEDSGRRHKVMPFGAFLLALFSLRLFGMSRHMRMRDNRSRHREIWRECGSRVCSNKAVDTAVESHYSRRFCSNCRSRIR